MRMMQHVARGEPDGVEIDRRLSVTKQVEGHTIYALGGAVGWPIQGFVRQFRAKIEGRMKAKKTGRVEAMVAV